MTADRTLSILLAEGNQHQHIKISRIINKAGFECAGLAASPPETRKQIIDLTPDALLISMDLADGPGDIIKTTYREQNIPVIAYSESWNNTQMRTAISAGAFSYLAGPLQAESLQSAVLAATARGLDVSTLRVHNKRLQKESTTDQLTGLYNRRGFNLILEKQVSMNKRTNIPMHLLYMDIDNFKRINDEYGHGVGDQLLRYTSDILRSSFRDADILARVGGDEFCCLLQGTEKPEVEDCVNRLNENLASNYPILLPQAELSISTGAVRYNDRTHPSTTAFIKAADKEMYKKKDVNRRKDLQEASPALA